MELAPGPGCRKPDVAALSDGSFLVVFDSDPTGSNYDVWARRMLADGSVVPIDIAVADGEQFMARAACAPGSDLALVTWADSRAGSGDGLELHGQRLQGSDLVGPPLTIAGGPRDDFGPAVAAAFADGERPAERTAGGQDVLSRLSPEDFVILSIASLTRNKGHDVLLTAMAELLPRHGGIRGIIVGEGPERRFLESRIDHLGLKNHAFLAGLRQDVLPFLHRADVVALCTIGREGLSVALIEGAAAGRPLVGSDLGGIPEVIEHGANGFLFRPGDTRELVQALERLITNPELRERMGQRSRALYGDRFSREVMIGRIEQMYDEVLQGRAHAS